MRYVKLKDMDMVYSNGKFIPMDKNNSDYKEVLSWMDEGNELTEVDRINQGE